MLKLSQIKVKTLCKIIIIGMSVTMTGATMLIYLLSGSKKILFAGIFLTMCAILWNFLLIIIFRARLTVFVTELCNVIDRMMCGEERVDFTDSETQFARICHRLSRFYQISQRNKYKLDEERKELQMLVSDISHQVKTPVSNLKMVTETLLEKPVTKQEQTEFLQGIRSQTDKLDFLFQALVKTSRMEVGAVRLEKKDVPLFGTLALAMSGIVYSAEKKEITVTVDCPEALHLPHDSKWTAEAIVNLLDNAGKYTPVGGRIRVAVEQWELYVKLDIEDTGRGIPESSQASVFRRFYREEEVHDDPGVGIGLYLAREIITKQGGYIKVVSEVQKGSVFSVFLPVR
ncbi:MAG: HAMP domain-containing histidine kinase [Lachnospiraceae bacterium]|nr:HAMP domain-containing histidine kinase [Lachnospiraceae bacterium]